VKTVLFLSARNLLRQKRRNAMLGVAIGFGMMILVMADSFASGLSDTLLNRVIVYMTGHLEVAMMEKSKAELRVIRDKDRFLKIIRDNLDDVKEIYEAIGVYTRVIGNGKSDNSIVIGFEMNQEMDEFLKNGLIDGKIDDFIRPKAENPVIIYDDKAKALNVKVGDIVRIRMSTIYGQQQTARLTVVAVIRANNIFESFAMFIPLRNIKELAGMKPYETGSFQVQFNRLNDPSFVIEQADKIHRLLAPGLAVIPATVSFRGREAAAPVFGYGLDAQSQKVLAGNIRMIAGSMPQKKDDRDALVNAALAKTLGLSPGRKITISYRNKFEGKTTTGEYRVAGVFSSTALGDGSVALMGDEIFYRAYLENLPAPAGKDMFMPDKKNPAYAALSPEWRLLPRTSDTESLHRKMRDMNRTKWKGSTIDVRTMYESASSILDLESALKIITLLAVIIMFFIILIGVINTLRMTVRERTREIGTMRAIGMQKNDVRMLFICETVLLSGISCAAGTVMAFILMGILGLFTINTTSIFSILLVNRHLYFYFDPASIAGNFALIMGITAVTAYFPAKRAAALTAAAALRQYE